MPGDDVGDDARCADEGNDGGGRHVICASVLMPRTPQELSPWGKRPALPVTRAQFQFCSQHVSEATCPPGKTRTKLQSTRFCVFVGKSSPSLVSKVSWEQNRWLLREQKIRGH